MQFPDREFGLIVGEPAEFRFFTSASRKNDPAGLMLDEVGDDLEELSPVEVNAPGGRSCWRDRARHAGNGRDRNGHAAALVRRQGRPAMEARVQRS